MMKSLPHTLLFTTTLSTSTVTLLSTNNPITMWTMLELNLLSFIPLMLLSQTKKETEAAVKYFLAQALGSSLLLTSIITSTHSPLFPSLSEVNLPLLSLALLTKLGAAPTHFWFPSTMQESSWPICLTLSTWQKIAPLSLLSLLTSLPTKTTFLFASTSALLGGIMGLSQTNINLLLAYSSIGHLGWLIALMPISLPLLTFYFLVYSLTLAILISLFFLLNVSTLSQIPLSNSPSSSTTWTIPLLLLSFGGLPPLLGFTPKFLAFKALLASSLYIAIAPLILGSSMNLAFYLNIAFNTALASPQTAKHLSHNPIPSPMIMAHLLLPLLTPLLLL